MYSTEIQQVLESNRYIVDYNTYQKICNSPQVKHVKYNSYENNYELWALDGYWKFKVK